MMKEEPTAAEDFDQNPDSLPPSRAAFLSIGTADFHPPEWAVEPLELNIHARLEAFRDAKPCATYMIATKEVTIFGRDQENCDHILGNPSISRKHAAIIHDEKGGIHIVDLMSRHGTYVNKKKLPPHDPYLLHEGDVIKFGQSIRVYHLKGASLEGQSATIKTKWPRVKLKAPKVSTLTRAVLPKIKPSLPKRYCPQVTKLVNDICYGTNSEEKTKRFLSNVTELIPEEKKELADFLVDKFLAKYEFYASYVHKNAYVSIMMLLKADMCVDFIEANLGNITHLSQQKHESIYRANARKILQFLAALRLDPEVANSIDFQSLAESQKLRQQNGHAESEAHHDGSSDHEEERGGGEREIHPCPETMQHVGARERVLSDEGKKLFVGGLGGGEGGGGSVGFSIPTYGPSRIETEEEEQGYGGGGYGGAGEGGGREERDHTEDEQEENEQSSGYAPPVVTSYPKKRAQPQQPQPQIQSQYQQPSQGQASVPATGQPRTERSYSSGHQRSRKSSEASSGHGRRSSTSAVQPPPQYQAPPPHQQQQERSGFGFMANDSTTGPAPGTQASPASTVGTVKSNHSAFGFISSTASSPLASTTKSAFSFMGGGDSAPVPGAGPVSAPARAPAPVPVVQDTVLTRAHRFLSRQCAMDPSDFESLWDNCDENTNGEEWSTILERPEAFDLVAFVAFLESCYLFCFASGKTAGMERFFFYAEALKDATLFLFEMTYRKSIGELTLTLKWIENSLLYENSHVEMLQLFQDAIQEFNGFDTRTTSHLRLSRQVTLDNYNSSNRGDDSSSVDEREALEETRTVSEVEEDEEEEAEEEKEEDIDVHAVGESLTKNPVVDPSQFERLWGTATIIGLLTFDLTSLPTSDQVIQLFEDNRLTCLASGVVHHLTKFYFFGEMIEVNCVFFIEMIMDATSSSVTSTLKRFFVQEEQEEELEQEESVASYARIDRHFLALFQHIVQEL